MSNNQLPADAQGKALTYSLKGSWINYPHPHQGKIFYPGTGQSEVYSRYLDGYIAGETALAESAQKEQEEMFKWFFSNRRGLIHCESSEEIKGHWQQWKDRKEVIDPCPHCGKELKRDRNLCCRECGKEVENE